MKGKATPKNVDEYLAGLPEPARGTLTKIRVVIRSWCRPKRTNLSVMGCPYSNTKNPWGGLARFQIIAAYSLRQWRWRNLSGNWWAIPCPRGASILQSAIPTERAAKENSDNALRWKRKTRRARQLRFATIELGVARARMVVLFLAVARAWPRSSRTASR